MIAAPVAPGTRGVTVILREEWHVFTGKVNAPSIADIAIRFTDGTETVQPLRCDIFLQPDPTLRPGFQVWPIERPGAPRQLAVHYQAKDSQEIRAVELRITEFGLQQQLTLRGGIARIAHP